ncbi:MAG: hypothetical protein A2W09_09065 [Deltaproteobacteria bacterium RBG_16_50_11]|nr:MAG: hypothetical protein A2W09_09065 [Deltaproteobacteria bacterium RBG_16_50_11]
MLTRREVLTELTRMGVKKLSLLKTCLREFEKYISTYYGFQVLRPKKTRQGDLSPATLELTEVTEKISLA